MTKKAHADIEELERDNREIVDWLKHHTLSDMKDLAKEIEDDGEDASDLVEVIRELEDIAVEEGLQEDVGIEA